MRVSKADVYSVNYGLPAIDKFYGVCCDESSSGPSQTEWHTIGCRGTNVKWTVGNCTLAPTSKLGIYVNARRVMVLSLHRSWNYLITGEQTTIWKGKAYDLSKDKDGHDCLKSACFYIVDPLPKGESFNATYYIENILQPILEYCLKSGLCQLLIHADNDRSHTIRKSRTFCESNSLWIAPHLLYSSDLTSSNFFFSAISSTSWRELHPIRKTGFFLKLTIFWMVFHWRP
jgi:hypothetical protein